jgi:hypothetical protein
MDEPVPAQPKTKKFEGPDRVELQLAELRVIMTSALDALDTKVGTGLKGLESKVDSVDTTLRLQRVEFGVLQKQVNVLYVWKDVVDDRLKNNSHRASAMSITEAEQDAKLADALAQLAEEKARSNRLEATAATKEDLRAITSAQTGALVEAMTTAAKNPTVQKLLWALAGLALVAINAATTYLTAKGR